MVNDDNALIERLRFEQVIRKYDDGRTLTQKLNPDGNDAADRIEALSAENERLREALKKPKAWLVSDGKTYWATVFEPYPKDHPHCDIIPLYSAPLGETK